MMAARGSMLRTLAARGARCWRRSMSSAAPSITCEAVLASLGLSQHNAGVYSGRWTGDGALLSSVNPATGEVIGSVHAATAEQYEETVQSMDAAKTQWMETPAPRRAEVVRKIGERLRVKKDDLGALISLEMGKILAEGRGEVQEAIDVCEYAVGMSRALNGQVIPSERPGHVMLERWNPLTGHVGIISAFNFPVAVFFWNAALALVTGNTMMWKPAESVGLTAVACTKIIAEVLEESGFPGAISSLICGDGGAIGEHMIEDPRNSLISFTGSTKVGRHVSEVVARRFGKSILELGGNNAMIVMNDADQDMALRAALFAAVGTAGQRCTSLRRLILHEDVYYGFLDRLVDAYKTVKVGNPLHEDVLCGPLHSSVAVDAFRAGIEEIESQDGEVLVGGNSLDCPGNFVEPTIAAIDHSADCVHNELFAPILYAFKVKSLDEAIQLNNSVPQGLSSSIFTKDISNMFQWTGANGSDCGLINVNIGTSGAEIGGAFGGEKETGGGRECGSDSWKNYCRRSTCTINFSENLPLSQGIVFGSSEDQ